MTSGTTPTHCVDDGFVPVKVISNDKSVVMPPTTESTAMGIQRTPWMWQSSASWRPLVWRSTVVCCWSVI